jgi:hypothetical protein
MPTFRDGMSALAQSLPQSRDCGCRAVPAEFSASVEHGEAGKISSLWARSLSPSRGRRDLRGWFMSHGARLQQRGPNPRIEPIVATRFASRIEFQIPTPVRCFSPAVSMFSRSSANAFARSRRSLINGWNSADKNASKLKACTVCSTCVSCGEAERRSHCVLRRLSKLRRLHVRKRGPETAPLAPPACPPAKLPAAVRSVGVDPLAEPFGELAEAAGAHSPLIPAISSSCRSSGMMILDIKSAQVGSMSASSVVLPSTRTPLIPILSINLPASFLPPSPLAFHAPFRLSVP